MTRQVRIAPARADQMSIITDILYRAARYPELIRDLPHRFREDLLMAAISRQEVHLAYLDGEAVGTLTLDWDDRRVWGDQPPIAGYLHRLAVPRELAHQGIGRTMIDWAAEEVKARGRQLLRLDFWLRNHQLRAYYEATGFYHVRDIELDGRMVTLYERRIT